MLSSLILRFTKALYCSSMVSSRFYATSVDKGEIYYLNTEAATSTLSRLQSSISQMYISAVSACDNKVLFLTSSGFVYETDSLSESPQVIFPLLQVKVISVECTSTASLAVAQIRLGKELVIIENQVITENKLIAYIWTADEEVRVVPQSLNMNIQGATIMQSQPVLFSNDSIFINKLQPARSVLRIDDQICYLTDDGIVRVVNGPEYKVS